MGAIDNSHEEVRISGATSSKNAESETRLFSFKEKIIQLFSDNLKGENFVKSKNNNHCGSEGNWVEFKFGVLTNNDNAPDIGGYELKKESSKYTFIDKVPSKMILEGIPYTGIWSKSPKGKKSETKNRFWNMFQRTNSGGIKIGGWKLDKWDVDGQCLSVDNDNNIIVLYNYSQDKRKDKNKLVSGYYKDNENHMIISWNKEHMEEGINNKWNQRGFIICKRDKNGFYNKICFGPPISFDFWITQLKQKNIIFEGYAKLNDKWRGSFRTSSKWLDKHITEEY